MYLLLDPQIPVNATTISISSSYSISSKNPCIYFSMTFLCHISLPTLYNYQTVISDTFSYIRPSVKKNKMRIGAILDRPELCKSYTNRLEVLRRSHRFRQFSVIFFIFLYLHKLLTYMEVYLHEESIARQVITVANIESGFENLQCTF